MTRYGPDTDLAGLEKLSEGYEAEIFAWEPGQVLRLYREGVGRDEAPERVGIPAALAGGIPAPSIGEAVSVAGREGLVMERIHGRNALDLVRNKPWLLLREGLATGRLHARMHAIPGPPRLAIVHERVAAWVGRAELPPHLAAIARELLAKLPGGERLCHGDYHLGNLLLEPGGRRVVIDWGFCAVGPPEADVARTLALMRLGRPSFEQSSISLSCCPWALRPNAATFKCVWRRWWHAVSARIRPRRALVAQAWACSSLAMQTLSGESTYWPKRGIGE